uniref:Uncharacterized protein n=1 Tax=Arundo donax TaxID=35708 RepID=A0A0A9BHU1_ARUDO
MLSVTQSPLYERSCKLQPTCTS